MVKLYLYSMAMAPIIIVYVTCRKAEKNVMLIPVLFNKHPATSRYDNTSLPATNIYWRRRRKMKLPLAVAALSATYQLDACMPIWQHHHPTYSCCAFSS